MKFDLEDKKKISLLCDLLKAFMSGKSNVLFVWHRNEGWAVLQNQEYLDNLDCSNLVNLCHIKTHFFSHISYESNEFLCFELDVTNYVRVLKSIKKQIKRMIWHIYNIDEAQNKALLQLNIIVDEGQMEVKKEIFLQQRMNPQLYFNIFRSFLEEKIQYLEIKQIYMKQMKDLKKNECVYFKFCNDYVSAYNNEEENNISIKKTALEKYDYNSLINNMGGKNRLTIPPNFLVPQVMMGIKLKDPIQLFIGNDIVDDHISVSLRTKNESFTFISQFKSIMEQDEEDFNKQNPFDVQRQQIQQQMYLNDSTILIQQPKISRNNNQNAYQTNALPNHFNESQADTYVANQRKQITYQENSDFQNPLNSYGSVQSHINGLTNQMHLIDNYNDQMEAEQEIPIQNNIYRRNDDFQQQQVFKKPQVPVNNNASLKTNKKKININQEIEQQQQHNNLNNSFAQSNQIYSVTSTQQSNHNYINESLLNKRKSDQANITADFSNLNFFKENTTKRIKESNYVENHQLPQYNQQQNMNVQKQQNPNTSRNQFINPLVSQDKQQNQFSIQLNQNKNEDDFSIFKSNSYSGAQLQVQKNQKNSYIINQPASSKTKFDKQLF
ncbi:hypothetical protein ABPG72_006973 [Tetrahymena utriculariae]